MPYSQKERLRTTLVGPLRHRSCAPDAEVADICYTYLRPKRKPRSIGELHGHLYFRAYLTFTAQQLLKLLQADIRFEVLGEEPWNAEVRVQRL